MFCFLAKSQCLTQKANLCTGSRGQEETYFSVPVKTHFGSSYIQIGYESFQLPSIDQRVPQPADQDFH